MNCCICTRVCCICNRVCCTCPIECSRATSLFVKSGTGKSKPIWMVFATVYSSSTWTWRTIAIEIALVVSLFSKLAGIGTLWARIAGRIMWFQIRFLEACGMLVNSSMFTVTVWLCWWCTASKILGVIFFQHHNSQLSDPVTVITSLLYQVALRLPTLQSLIYDETVVTSVPTHVWISPPPPRVGNTHTSPP